MFRHGDNNYQPNDPKIIPQNYMEYPLYFHLSLIFFLSDEIWSQLSTSMCLGNQLLGGWTGNRVPWSPMVYHIWRFPKMGVPWGTVLNHPFLDGVFHHKPSILGLHLWKPHFQTHPSPASHGWLPSGHPWKPDDSTGLQTVLTFDLSWRVMLKTGSIILVIIYNIIIYNMYIYIMFFVPIFIYNIYIYTFQMAVTSAALECRIRFVANHPFICGWNHTFAGFIHPFLTSSLRRGLDSHSQFGCWSLVSFGEIQILFFQSTVVILFKYMI